MSKRRNVKLISASHGCNVYTEEVHKARDAAYALRAASWLASEGIGKL